MSTLDSLDKLFVVWAFFFQLAFIAHFAVRKRFFVSYTLKYGWIVYALCIPAALVSIVLFLGGKSVALWLGGLLFVAFSAYGYWIDYVKKDQWRSPLVLPIALPYVLLYLSTVMFYWWPLWPISRLLWFAYTILYVIAMVLNIRSH